jgi:hypothetical protein
MKPERRRSPRYPFIETAEVTQPDSGTVLVARTSDISPDGCYLDTINPLPPNTIVEIKVIHRGQLLVAEGVVTHAHPNMGMGVKFITLEKGCAILLDTWLRETARV